MEKKPEEMTITELKALLFDLQNSIQFITALLQKKIKENNKDVL